MTAGLHNFKAEEGADFIRTLTWTDDADALIDLTGYTARMQVRREIDDSATLLELTTANSRITLGGTAGTIALILSMCRRPHQTAALRGGNWRLCDCVGDSDSHRRSGVRHIERIRNDE